MVGWRIKSKMQENETFVAVVGIPALGGSGLAELIGIVFGIAVLVAFYLWWNRQ